MKKEIKPGVTLYFQIASRIRSRILDGEWALGETLPPIPELCREYDVGTVTVRQALKLLADEGLLVSQRGRGTVLTKALVPVPQNLPLRRSINDPLELGADQKIDLLLCEEAAALPGPLATGEAQYPRYMHIRKIHRHQEKPFALIDIYVAKQAFDRFPPGAEKREKIARLFRDYGAIRLVSVRQEVTILPMEGEAAGHLQQGSSNYPVSNVLVHMLKWWSDETGRIAFAGRHHYRADMFVLDVKHEVRDFYEQTTPGLIPKPS